jgi:hypothetical protein
VKVNIYIIRIYTPAYFVFRPDRHGTTWISVGADID